MSLDSLNARALLLEIAPQLLNSRVQKFSQLDQLNFLLHLRSPGRTDHLLLCLHPEQSRFHLLNHRHPPAVAASSFVMLGRKLFGGCRLEDLYLHSTERSLCLEFSSGYRLIFDWSGQPPALIISSPEAISLNIHPPRGRFLLRQPYPLAYTPPEDPTGAELLNRLRDLPDRPPLAKALTRAYAAIPPLWAKRLAREQDLVSAWDQLLEPFKENRADLLNPGFEDDGELSFRTKVVKSCPTMNLAVLERWMSGSTTPGLSDHSQELLRRLNKGRDKSRRKLEKRQKDLVGAQSAPLDQLYGDLLLAYGSGIARRQSEFKTKDWEGRPLAIALDPELSGPENAERYYKRAKKKKRALSVLTQQIELANDEVSFWDELILAAEQAENRTDIEEVAKAIPKPHQKKRQRAPLVPSSGPRRFEHQGFQLLVGRNPTQNEKLSLHQAAKEDHWFHIRQGAGSHVILRTAGKIPGEQTIKAAAWLAAFYSSASNSSRCEVVTTLVRYLKKPKESSPGKVIYSQEHALISHPSSGLPEGLVRIDQKGK